MSVETPGLPPLRPLAEPHPKVICIIVNWNGWQDTLACLDSLRLQDYPNLVVIVIDNGSTNDSARRIQEAHPWVTFHQLPANIGFPSGCNVGTRMAYHMGADFIWLLNNDTVAPPHTASALVRTALAHPEAGAIGSVLYFLHDPTRVQAWGGGNINRWTGYSTHFTAPAPMRSSSYITFASALIPRQLYEQLGGLYEGAFMYFEDADFCMRVQAAGWQLVVAEDTAILHKEGGSITGKNPQLDAIVTTAGIHFLRRHAPVPALAVLLFVGSRLLKRLLRGDLPASRAVFEAARNVRQTSIPPFQTRK